LARPNTVVVPVGTADARIVMEPVWAFSFLVLDDETSRPITLEHVSVVGQIPPPEAEQRWRAVSGDDDDWFSGDDRRFATFRGYFAQQDVPGDDEFEFRVSALGYERKTVKIQLSHPEQTGYLEPTVVRLAPLGKEGTLELSVTVHGEPIREALLLEIVEVGRGRRSWARIESRDVDTRGRREIRLPAGRYQVRVAGFPRAPTFQSDAVAVTVPENGTVTHVVDVDAGILEVQVVDATECGLANARVWILGQDASPESWLLSASDSLAVMQRYEPLVSGRFLALLKPGTYVVKAACFGFTGRLDKVLVVGRRRTRLDVRLEEEK